MALDRSEVSKEIDHIDTGGSATFKTMFFQDICLGWSLSDTPFSNKILISMMQVKVKSLKHFFDQRQID